MQRTRDDLSHLWERWQWCLSEWQRRSITSKSGIIRFCSTCFHPKQLRRPTQQCVAIVCPICLHEVHTMSVWFLHSFFAEILTAVHRLLHFSNFHEQPSVYTLYLPSKHLSSLNFCLLLYTAVFIYIAVFSIPLPVSSFTHTSFLNL